MVNGDIFSNEKKMNFEKFYVFAGCTKVDGVRTGWCVENLIFNVWVSLWAYGWLMDLREKKFAMDA